MKVVLLSCFVLVSSASLASMNMTVYEGFEKGFPDALAQAVLLDAPLCTSLWGLGVIPNLAGVSLCSAAALTGYTIRRTCKFVLSGTESPDSLTAMMCGFAGGSVKYSGKALVTGSYSSIEPVLGAMDAGTYEGTANWRNTLENAGQTLAPMAIETAVATLAHLTRPALGPHEDPGLWSKVKGAAAASAIFSGYVHLFYIPYAKTVQESVTQGFAWLSKLNTQPGGDL